MNIHFVLQSPWSEAAAAAVFALGYVLGRYHGAEKVLRDQHNARVPAYPRQPSDAS
jgi:hypothetical protein